MKLHELQPAVRFHHRSQASGPRRRFRSGQDLRQGPQGRQGAFRRRQAPRIRGRPDAPVPSRAQAAASPTSFGTEYACVNVERLEIFNDGDVVTAQSLIDAGIIKKTLDGVKIMGNGELTKKLTVQASKFTASAKEKIEALGGKAEVI